MSKTCPNCGSMNAGNESDCVVCGFELDKNYFDVLGISVTDDLKKIKKAYNSQVVKCHPDKTAHLSKELQRLSDKKMKQLNHIMDVMKDEQKRNSYISEVSDKNEIVICPSCNAKNRIPKNKAQNNPKCGKCGTFLFEDQEEFEANYDDVTNNSNDLDLTDYVGYVDESGISRAVGHLKNEDTLCFVAVKDQIGIMWKWHLGWFLTGMILYNIALYRKRL